MPNVKMSVLSPRGVVVGAQYPVSLAWSSSGPPESICSAGFVHCKFLSCKCSLRVSPPCLSLCLRCCHSSCSSLTLGSSRAQWWVHSPQCYSPYLSPLPVSCRLSAPPTPQALGRLKSHLRKSLEEILGGGHYSVRPPLLSALIFA